MRAEGCLRLNGFFEVANGALHACQVAEYREGELNGHGGQSLGFLLWMPTAHCPIRVPPWAHALAGPDQRSKWAIARTGATGHRGQSYGLAVYKTSRLSSNTSGAEACPVASTVCCTVCFVHFGGHIVLSDKHSMLINIYLQLSDRVWYWDNGGATRMMEWTAGCWIRGSHSGRFQQRTGPVGACIHRIVQLTRRQAAALGSLVCPGFCLAAMPCCDRVVTGCYHAQVRMEESCGSPLSIFQSLRTTR